MTYNFLLSKYQTRSEQRIYACNSAARKNITTSFIIQYSIINRLTKPNLHLCTVLVLGTFTSTVGQSIINLSYKKLLTVSSTLTPPSLFSSTPSGTSSNLYPKPSTLSSPPALSQFSYYSTLKDEDDKKPLKRLLCSQGTRLMIDAYKQYSKKILVLIEYSEESASSGTPADEIYIFYPSTRWHDKLARSCCPGGWILPRGRCMWLWWMMIHELVLVCEHFFLLQ